MKPMVTLLALALLTTGGFRAFAEPQTQNPPAAVANPPWIASENDIVGQWSWGAGGDLGWEAHFSADHTVTVYQDGFVERGPILSTWTLKNNHVMVDNAPLIKYLGASYPSKDTAKGRTPNIFDKFAFGSDLQVIRYQGSVVLYSTAQEANVQKYGPAPWFCYWQYVRTKKGNALPPAGTKLREHALEMFKQEQDKKR